MVSIESFRLSHTPDVTWFTGWVWSEDLLHTQVVKHLAGKVTG